MPRRERARIYRLDRHKSGPREDWAPRPKPAEPKPGRPTVRLSALLLAHMSTRGGCSRPAPDRAGDADAAKTSRRARRDTGYVGESPADDGEVGRSIPRGCAAVEDVTVAMRRHGRWRRRRRRRRRRRTAARTPTTSATMTTRRRRSVPSPASERRRRRRRMDDEAGDGDELAGRRPSRGVARRARAQGEQARARPAPTRAQGARVITRRRSAQIANYRRDRKIEIEEQREAMAQAKVASYGAAAKDGGGRLDDEQPRRRHRGRGGRHRALARDRPPARASASRASTPPAVRGAPRGAAGRRRPPPRSRGSPRPLARTAGREPTRAAAAHATDTREVRQPAKRLGRAWGVRADGARRHEGAEGRGEAQRGGARGRALRREGGGERAEKASSDVARFFE